MRLHRFYVGDTVELGHDFWINDLGLLHQWQKVFRLSEGAEVVLFDGRQHDRLYKITKLEKGGAHLEYVTDFERQLPKKDVYLLFALLKKDKNDWVLQKATELGVNHFWPIISEHSEQKELNTDRSKKIIIEAAEQCGRSNIPSLREPELLEMALKGFEGKGELYVCQQGEAVMKDNKQDVGLVVGPEGGWSEKEKQLFKEAQISHLGLGEFTLRAETAAIAAAAKLLQ